MATLNYLPDYSAQLTMKPRVNKMQFGDGYEQRQSDGLNTKLQSWSVKFKRNTVEAQAINDFLTNLGGVDAFNWTTPDEYAATFVCEDWGKTTDDAGWETVSATFREVPEVVSP